MNSIEFAQLLESTFTQLQHLTATKGAEYAHDADQLANFKRLGSSLSMHPSAVLLVYLAKHMDAVTAYVAALNIGTQPIESEPISGRIDDAILYLVLLKALLQCQASGMPSP